MTLRDTKEELELAGTFLRWGFIWIIVIAVLLGLANVLGFASFSFFAPKIEQVRYNTFKESQSYNDGMIRDLEDLKMEYFKASTEQKEGLKAIILHRFAAFDINKMPDDLQIFYITLRGV